MSDETKSDKTGKGSAAGTPKEETPSAPNTDTSATTAAAPVDAKLKALGVDDDMISKIRKDLGVEGEGDLAFLEENLLGSIGMKPVRAKKLLAAIKPTTSPTESVASPISGMGTLDVLPKLPDDGSWLQALKIGGALKFSRETVIGTVSAALANRVGLYGLPSRIVDAMEEHAMSLDEPVPTEFFEMQKALTERNYAEIFAAIPGATGRYATQSRKKALLSKIDENLWDSLVSFQELLIGWLDSWQKGMANPAAMMSALGALAGGGGMPTGMMAPPPTDNLRASAEGLIDSINRIFAGTGIPVAMALAYDAQQIRATLEKSTLPGHVGATNRDQMLKKLGVAVSSDYPRLEANLKQYVLGVIELPNVTAGQTELTYITALHQLGAAIPWNQISGGVPGRSRMPGGIGGRVYEDQRVV